MSTLDMFTTSSTGEARVRDRRHDSSAANETVWTPDIPAQACREEQTRQLARVSGRIADGIRAFLRARGAGGTFYAHELAAAVGGAPSSADRVLRMLRNAGEVTYSVNRSSSLYTIETLSHVEAKP